MRASLVGLLAVVSIMSPWLAQSGKASEGQTHAKVAAKAATKTNKHTNLTGDQAVLLVEKLPAVKAWKASCIKGGAQARKVTLHVDLDRKEGSTYFVHVYEEVPDDATSSHSATFNWYDVDEKTGKIKPEL